jgi:tRNA (guanine6-N2)-methyltransferase
MTISPPGEVLKRQSHLFDRLVGGTPGLLFTTDPGLEDLAAAEAVDRLGQRIHGGLYERRPHGFHGHALILPPRHDPSIGDVARQMRSVHHVIEPRYAFQLSDDDPLGGIRSTLAERGVEADLHTQGSFRVTSSRHGEHPFSSMDVQRVAGAGLVERHGMKVDLTDFDTEIRVDVRHGKCLVGVQLTRERLSKRPWRLYHPRASLRAKVAYALLRFAGISQGRLLDPFCGSATIPIEATSFGPDLQIVASDYSEEAIEGAHKNIAAADVGDRISIDRHDLNDLSRIHQEGSFDLIVTNPPYGIRVGQGMNFFAFYTTFLRTAAYLLRPGGCLVFLAWKRSIVDKVLQQEIGLLQRRHSRIIEMGGIYPRIYVLDRL